MKKALRYILSSMLSVLVLAGSVSAQARAEEVDWNALFDICTTDWNHYGRRLNELRESLSREIADISEAEYNERFLGDDPKILLMQVTWPESLRGKDKFWRAHVECSDFHREARQALDSNLSSAAAKKEAVEAFSDCVFDRYTRGRRLPPLDRMLRCYDSQRSK